MNSNKKLVISICVVTIILHCFIACIYLDFNSNQLNIEYVSTEADAIEIGKIICKNVYPQFDYTDVIWTCFELNDGTWMVSCSPQNSVPKLGGGYPQVHIKRNAQVVLIGLKK